MAPIDSSEIEKIRQDAVEEAMAAQAREEERKLILDLARRVVELEQTNTLKTARIEALEKQVAAKAQYDEAQTRDIGELKKTSGLVATGVSALVAIGQAIYMAIKHG